MTPFKAIVRLVLRGVAQREVAEATLLSPLFVFKKGKDITYKEGKPFVAYVTQDYTF